MTVVLSAGTYAQEARDSVVQIVFNALTSDQPNVHKPIKPLLMNARWEALAYWDSNTPKELQYMSEAVGDLYEFREDGSFTIRLVDPDDPRSLGLEIKGTYRLEDLAVVLISENGKEMSWNIHYLDKNYLILNSDGLRIFYTKSKSYFTYD